MPRLESLAVSRESPSLHNVTKKQVAAFLQFDTDGDLPLRELRLCNFWVSDADLLKLLKRSPRLELLAIVNGKTSDKVIDALSAKQPGKPARWICPNLSRICIISDSSSKSDKFRVTGDGMGALVTARLRANLSTPRRAAGPAVARLMNVRLDNYDVVFSNILDVDWAWKLDEEASWRFNYIDPTHLMSRGPRWWHYQSQWEEIY
ncbi:hypothetical protein AURDEDRAFT_111129 [Auricularia subglabra TFB-10046 SS5]|nr:hypothetical protein AURDEDRAFT_111129 [Auricularia subglabra TFB-10046 SS5]